MTLFRPIQIGKHTLEHRVVLAPVTRYRGDENHAPTDLVTEYYSQRTTPGGLLVTEGILISDSTSGVPGTVGIYTDLQVERWVHVVEAVHAKKGIIFAQLWHLGRAASSLYRLNNKASSNASAVVVGPSAIAPRGINHDTGEPYEVPHELTVDEIQSLVQEHVTAAKNAIKAGFDGVEIPVCFGYLINQFLHDGSNKRTDVYGGSIENRARFALEIVEAIVSTIGAERTSIRFTPWGTLGDCEDSAPYETYSYVLKHLNPNLAYVSFVEKRDSDDDNTNDKLRTVEDFEKALDPFRIIWKGPFIAAGGYSTAPELIAQTIEENPSKNLIAVGRAFIANPDLVKRLKYQWPLNQYDRATFYQGGSKGYTDYPFYTAKKGQ